MKKNVFTSALLHKHAFDNSLLANIIVANGSIIRANRAACRLLSYTREELLTTNEPSIFDINENSFKRMLKQRSAEGEATAFVTAIKNRGARFTCNITSSIFIGENGIEKTITTITDISESILKQKNIDFKNKKIVATNIMLARSRQKDIDFKNKKIVAANILLARLKQKANDIKKEKIVAFNIMLAKSKQKSIDVKNRIIVDQNILDAQLKSDNKLAESTEWIKFLGERRIAERLSISRILNENINHLLCASRLYLNMAKHGGENKEILLSRSSQYTLIAIEEIGKLSRSLATEVINSSVSTTSDSISYNCI